MNGAPANCAGGTTKSLTSLAITGPATVAESGTATYIATARFSDGSSQVVTTTATWTENSTFATIAGGVLTATAVTGNQPVTISSSFTSAGVTRSATLAVSVLDSAPPPPPVTGSHAGRFAVYEGTKTCLTCHLDRGRGDPPVGALPVERRRQRVDGTEPGPRRQAGRHQRLLHLSRHQLAGQADDEAPGRSLTAAARAATPVSD